MIQNKIKSAFTLAEVLITLMIIGVVAAMSIPSLMSYTNDLELKSAMRKNYSELNNAVNQLISDNGGDLTNFYTTATDLRNKLSSSFDVIKTCSNGITGGCWASSIYQLDGSTTGAAHISGFTGLPSFVTKAGVSFGVYNIDGTPACTPGHWSGCGTIAFDVNGTKGPNTWGKDIFFARIKKDRLEPIGYNDPYPNKCTGSTGWDSGFSCVYEFLKK